MQNHVYDEILKKYGLNFWSDFETDLLSDGVTKTDVQEYLSKISKEELNELVTNAFTKSSKK